MDEEAGSLSLEGVPFAAAFIVLALIPALMLGRKASEVARDEGPDRVGVMAIALRVLAAGAVLMMVVQPPSGGVWALSPLVNPRLYLPLGFSALFVYGAGVSASRRRRVLLLVAVPTLLGLEALGFALYPLMTTTEMQSFANGWARGARHGLVYYLPIAFAAVFLGYVWQPVLRILVREVWTIRTPHPMSGSHTMRTRTERR